MTYPLVPIHQLITGVKTVDPSRRSGPTFRYIDISSIDRDQKCISSTTEIVTDQAPSRARQLVQRDDVLVSTVRPNLNAVALVPEDLDGEIASTGFCVLRANPDALNARYLFYFVRTDSFVASLLQHVRGANYPAVTDSIVKAVLIPLPPPSEQRRIVELLDQADTLRLRRAESDAKGQRILPALFIKMFGDPAMNPMGWPTAPLSEVAEIGTRLVDPGERRYLDLPHIGVEEIEKDTGRIISPKLVRDDNLRSNKFHFTREHVLYSKIRPYLNKVAYPGFEGLCSADIYPLRPKNNRITLWYLVGLLRSNAFLTYTRMHSERLRMPKLNREQLGAFKTPLPSAELLEAFEGRAESLATIDVCRFRRALKTGKLLDAITYRAFSGDLTARWRKTHVEELLREANEQAEALEAGGSVSARGPERGRAKRAASC